MLSNSQPVIKILKRPPNLVSPEQVNGINSCNVKQQPVVKSLQQREMEYAEARLRIFGTSETEEKLRNCKSQLNEVPKRIIKPARKDTSNIIRYPRGPDGTKGFHTRYRENVTEISCENDQFNMVSNGLLDTNG